MIDFCSIDEKSDADQQSASVRGVARADSQDASQPTTAVQNVPAQTGAAPAQSENITPEEAVRAATIDFNILKRYWVRRQLRYWAWYAKRTRAGEQSLLLSWDHGPDEFEGYFRTNAFRFGQKIDKHVPSSLKQRLEGFVSGSGEPFLIIRGVFSRTTPPRFAKTLDDDPKDPPRKIVGETAKRLLYKGHFNLIASALVAAAGAKLRPKLSTDPVYRDFFTDIGAEKNQFGDGSDMHLRYRTATPEKTPMANGDNEAAAARVLLFACIENPIADPIYLIRADQVVSRLSDKHRNRLQETRFFFFDNWASDTIEHNKLSKMKRILYDGSSKTDPWVSFDSNRFAPKDEEGTTEHRSAVSALMASIRQVAAESERKIVLHQGDALIVDNYRALTRRHEHGHVCLDFRPLLFFRPPVRWLRVYYGFPK